MIYDGTYESYCEICEMVGDANSTEEYWEHNLRDAFKLGTLFVVIGKGVEKVNDGRGFCGFRVYTPSTAPSPQHPLLNPDSKHYEMIGGVQAIELLEAMYTVDELMAWAKLNAMKYRLRIGDKDDPEKEIAKIKTYEAYWRYLDARK